MKKSFLIICLALSVMVLVSGCKKKPKPLSERIAKAWTAETVNHDNTLVYARGGSSNTWPGYSNFRLTLTNTSGVLHATLIEWNGDRFEGDWELDGDTKLILKNLSPEPTGSGGTIQFSINTIGDSQLILTRLSSSKKTGDTVNKYTLSNP